MAKKPSVCGDMPPLELWAEGIEKYVRWDNGKYRINPGSPEWVKNKLDEYNSMCNPVDEGDMVTQY